jgi:hypothetical protein
MGVRPCCPATAHVWHGLVRRMKKLFFIFIFSLYPVNILYDYIHYYTNFNRDGHFGLTEAGNENATDERSRLIRP